MRRLGLYSVLLLAACSDAGFGAARPEGHPPLDAPDAPDDGDGDGRAEYSLEVDTSETSSFVDGLPSALELPGRATASLGLDSLEIGGANVAVDGAGRFAAQVPIVEGMQLVPIVATDGAGHVRRFDRAMIAGRFLPEGQTNPGAVGLTLDDETLTALIAPIAARIAEIDLREQVEDIGDLQALICSVHPTDVSHDRLVLAPHVNAAGELAVTVTIPNLKVGFTGGCNFFVGQVSFSGSIDTAVDVSSILTAPPSDGCIERLEHSYPEVSMAGFDLELESNDPGLVGLIVPIVGEIFQGTVADLVSDAIARQSDEMLADQTSNLRGFDLASAPVDFLGVPIDIGLCLRSLHSEPGQLGAWIGVSAAGPGDRAAPGAPVFDGSAPDLRRSSLWLDANLVSQVLFSVWRAGGIGGEIEGDVDVELLSFLAPEIGERYPADSPVTVSINAGLPPAVRAAAPADGDLMLDIGDLSIDLRVEDELVFQIGAFVHLTLDLEVDSGALVPKVVSSEANAYVLAESIADIEDAILTDVVAAKIGEAAQSLLGTIRLDLASLGLPLSAVAVTAEDGGRYVRVDLAR